MRESALLSLMLTIFSVIATWTISYMHSQTTREEALDKIVENHNASLRMYALKAAEKVLNLSNELSGLSTYLELALAKKKGEPLEHEVIYLNERIESAIQQINTLRSVNDTALSDWEGVIGEELDRQREEQRAREKDIYEMLEEITARLDERSESFGEQSDYGAMLKGEIELLRKELVNISARVAPPSIVRFGSQKRLPLSRECPVCGNNLTVKTNKRGKVPLRGLSCKWCGTKLIQMSNGNGGLVFKIREDVPERCECPICQQENFFMLDNLLSANCEIQCRDCGQRLRVSRSSEGLRVSVVESAMWIPSDPNSTERLAEFLEKNKTIADFVRRNLPVQPWPTGIHKVIAEKLGVSNRLISVTIQALISSGEYKNQVDGEIIHDC